MPSPTSPRVSVILPTHDRAAFVPRALGSLAAQDYADWELWIVDDGSADGTREALAPWLADPRVHLHRLPRNRGLGAALNAGLAEARGELIAYLPSDDVLQPNHLATLVATLDASPHAVLAYAGLRHHYSREATDPLPGDGLQLVQLLHRRVPGFRWLERDELVTDALDRMGLAGLAVHGAFVGSGQVTCEWVSHPGQLHRLLREPVGGIAAFRRRYRIAHPLRFHTTTGDRIDEVERYARYRTPEPPAGEPMTPAAPTASAAVRPARPASAAPKGLRILLVGELAYNADRILALEEAGHQLFGLWMPDPYWYNTVGPLPFGHVVDATSDDPAEAIRETGPDIIYALLNWQAVPFAARVLRANPGVPFVWHFKEGPFISLEQGHWPDLVDLVRGAHGVIHSSEEMRRWFAAAVPGADDPSRTLVLDGDLPKADWMAGPLPRRLSEDDGEVHTVVPGRPIGLHPGDVAELAARGIHLHFHGDFTQGQWREWIDRTIPLAPRHLHLHPTVGPEGWVRQLGRYDAGWLHVFRSRNGGEIRRADWDDLNVPARMATLAVAGVPFLQRSNLGHLVAAQRLALETGSGLVFEDWDGLAAQLRDEALMAATRTRLMDARPLFTFDAHVDRLTRFLERLAGDRTTGRAPVRGVEPLAARRTRRVADALGAGGTRVQARAARRR